MKTKNIHRLFILPLLLVFLVCCTSNRFPKGVYSSTKIEEKPISQAEEFDTGKTTGNSIVNALEEYYLENGVYPETLEVLIPNYLSELPTTITGQMFNYKLLSIESSNPYSLSFPLSTKISTACYYFRSLELQGLNPWDCGFTQMPP